VTVCVTDDDGGEGCDHLKVTVVHGFLRFCAYADDEEDGVTAYQDVVASCAQVPSGIPGEMRPGGLGSRGTVRVKDRAAIQHLVLSLTGRVDVAKDADVWGTLTAGYDVKVDQRTQIHDSITSGHRVEVKRNAWVDGDIIAADRVTVDPDATVTGTVSETAVVPPIPGIHWVEFSATPGAEDVTVGAGDSLALEPGAYRDVRLRRGAALTLRAGHYSFRKLTAGRGAGLELDLSDGTILVDVAGKLQLQQNVQMSITLHEGQPTGAPTDVLFRVAHGFDGAVRDAGAELQGGGAYLGTFLAPYSLVELGEEATLVGALYGKTVAVGQGAQISGLPSRDLFASLYVAP
jgi:cytoskeletal protein CcmA (bactofilin family)